jgi:O-antigen/teichoic acid export membrane protein
LVVSLVLLSNFLCVYLWLSKVGSSLIIHDFKNMKEKLLKNTVSNIFFKIIIMGMGIITTPIVVDAVGKEKFGFIILAGTITGYFSVLGLGIPGAVIKYIAEFNSKKDNENITKTINSSLILFFIIGISIAITIVIFINTGGLKLFNISQDNYDSAKKVLYVASLVAIISWPSLIFQHTLEGLQKYHKLNIIQLISRIIGLACTIITAILKYPVEIIFLAYNLSLIISRIWEYFLLKKNISFWKFTLQSVNKSTIKFLFSFSIWLFILQISGILTYQTDKIIVGTMLPISMLTYYFVLFKPIEIIKNLIGFFRVAVMPAASEKYTLEGVEGVNNLIFRASKYFNAFLAPLAVMGVFLCKPFISLWMGTEYLEYAYVTQIYFISLIFIQSNGLLGEIFIGTGKAKKLAIIGISQSVFNVAISIYLVSLIGVGGVLLGTVISETICILTQYFVIFPDLKIKKFIYLKKAIVSGNWLAIVFAFCLLPFLSYFNSITSWTAFFLTGSILTMIIYLCSFFFIVQKEDKKFIISNVRNFVTIQQMTPALRSRVINKRNFF